MYCLYNKIIISYIIVVCCIFGVTQTSYAELTSGQISIEPAKTEISIVPGVAVERNIKVTNGTDNNVIVSVSSEDIVGSRDPESPVVLLGENNGEYGLRNFIKPTTNTLELNPGESKSVSIVVDIPQSVDVGSKYGAVVFSIKTINSGNAVVSGAGATINTRLAAVFLVRVPGNLNESGLLLDFDTTSGASIFFSGLPNFVSTFENTGNVHLNPYGVIEVKNMFGGDAGRVFVPPAYVLPKSSRTNVYVWPKSFRFGMYSAELSLNRGYGDIIDSKKINFVILPWGMLLLFILGLLVVLALFRQLRMYFRLNFSKNV